MNITVTCSDGLTTKISQTMSMSLVIQKGKGKINGHYSYTGP